MFQPWEHPRITHCLWHCWVAPWQRLTAATNLLVLPIGTHQSSCTPANRHAHTHKISSWKYNFLSKDSTAADLKLCMDRPTIIFPSLSCFSSVFLHQACLLCSVQNSVHIDNFDLDFLTTWGGLIADNLKLYFQYKTIIFSNALFCWAFMAWVASYNCTFK